MTVSRAINPCKFLELLEPSSCALDTLLRLFVPGWGSGLGLADRTRDRNDFVADACSSFTVFNEAPHIIACSNGLISSTSSIVDANSDSDSKATIASCFCFGAFWSWGVHDGSSPSSWSVKRTKVVSHTKCSGVLPSSSCASHAAGYALAMSLSSSGEAFEPAAMWRGVLPRPSLAAAISGHSLMMLATISNGGLSLTIAWRSVMPLSLCWEHEDMESAKSRKQSGLVAAMSVRIIFQSWLRISPSRTATGFSSLGLELDIVILLLLLLLLALL